MTNVEEFQSRPRLRLLELLAEREIDYGEFALGLGLVSEPETWSSGKTREREHLSRAKVALRVYTHGRPDPEHPDDPARRTYRTPSRELIVRWAEYFELDPGYFWSRGRPEDRVVAERRLARKRRAG